MQTQLTKDVDLIVESEDPGPLEVSVTSVGDLIVKLTTKCSTCSRTLTVQFNLGNRITVDETWQSNPVQCPNCRIKQLRKIRYHVQARKEGMNE